MGGSEYKSEIMTKACELALKGKGFTAPNPLVGAIVLDKAGNIVGQGFHPRAGEPHAEVFAITEALKTQPEKRLEDCQLYVTLEPCHHFGRTPPCTDLILKAGIKTVFVGVKDPNPLMQGESLKMLRSAGVNVHTVAADDPNYGFCLELIRGFESVLSKGRPYVTLKAGASIDGKMATGSGESQWITNGKSRAMAHFLRSRHDAIAIGVGTVIKDNPRLNPRLPDQEYLRKKIIFDTKLRSPAEANVFSSPGDSIVFCGPERNSNKKVQLEALGVQVIEVSASHEVGLSIENVLKKCAALGIQDILVEGGPTLLGSFVRDDLYDQIYLFMSPKIIGANGRSIFEGFNIPKLQNAAQLTNTSISLLGDDIVWRGERICSQA